MVIPEGADEPGAIALARPAGAENYTSGGRLKKSFYEAELARLQEELVKLQYWVQDQGLKVLIIFEGRGSAGKGGVINRITERTSPRTVKLVALPKPTEREQTQWYFQRYVEHLPAAGEVVLFDRSWYNRSNVEWVMDFCTESAAPRVPSQLSRIRTDARAVRRESLEILVLVSWDEQRKRFESRNEEPLRDGSSRTWISKSTACTSSTRWRRTRRFNSLTSNRHRGTSCPQTTSAMLV